MFLMNKLTLSIILGCFDFTYFVSVIYYHKNSSLNEVSVRHT